MTPAVAVPLIRPASRDVSQTTAEVSVRQGTPEDADAIHGLICAHRNEGHLLARSLSEITVHARRFVVAVDGNRVVACADLAPLSRTVAEVRSLVVSEAARSNGIGRQLVDALIDRAARSGFVRVCVFTHAPAYFVQLGFSIVPHEWLPEKIQADCASCAQFRRCGQYAVMLSLAQTRHNFGPLASLHG